MGTSNCLDTNILQNILFYVQQKKESNNARMGKWTMTELHFWVNYPFKRFT